MSDEEREIKKRGRKRVQEERDKEREKRDGQRSYLCRDDHLFRFISVNDDHVAQVSD